MFQRKSILPLVILLVLACSESTGPEAGAEVWGEYDYASASLVPTYVDDDSVAIVPEFRKGSFTLEPGGGTFELSAEDDTWTGDVTDVDLDGTRLRFMFGGLEHEGEVDGRAITGAWTGTCPDGLQADCDLVYPGIFTAARRR